MNRFIIQAFKLTVVHHVWIYFEDTFLPTNISITYRLVLDFLPTLLLMSLGKNTILVLDQVPTMQKFKDKSMFCSTLTFRMVPPTKT